MVRTLYVFIYPISAWFLACPSDSFPADSFPGGFSLLAMLTIAAIASEVPATKLEVRMRSLSHHLMRSFWRCTIRDPFFTSKCLRCYPFQVARLGWPASAMRLACIQPLALGIVFNFKSLSEWTMSPPPTIFTSDYCPPPDIIPIAARFANEFSVKNFVNGCLFTCPSAHVTRLLQSAKTKSWSTKCAEMLSLLSLHYS